MAEDTSNETASDLTRIAPSVIICIPTWPETSVTVAIVRRHRGQATNVRIYRRNWT